MSKNNTVFICQNCSFKSQKWQGKCPECGQWNTFEEIRTLSSSSGKANTSSPAQIILLSEVEHNVGSRIASGIRELDIVLGGGIVPGALVLLGGDPGVGKSTLALQIALNMDAKSNLVYVSGEESAQQIKLRKDRISTNKDLAVLPETDLETIISTLETVSPQIAIIDSIQTLRSGNVNGVVGGVSQITYATDQLMRVAKTKHIAIIIIGHVTKEGVLAGPKTLEHMVDTVLYLEGERFTELRVLRCNKNRFGSTSEVGVFSMSELGLLEVGNPSLYFLGERTQNSSGSALSAVLEGNKVLLMEVQGLTTQSKLSNPRRNAIGFDQNRLQLLLAILQKRLQLNLWEMDVFINVAGGYAIDEPAADLAVVLAVLSSFYDLPLPNDLVAIGEVGLSGEIRGVTNLERRVNEVNKLGFKNIWSSKTSTKGTRQFTHLSEIIKQLRAIK